LIAQKKAHLAWVRFEKPLFFAMRQQVQANAPLEFVRRPPAVDRVFGLQVFHGLIEANPIQHWVHR